MNTDASGGEATERSVGLANSGGFTMVELLVVLFLAGVVATIVVPRLDLQGARVRSAAAEVHSTLSRAARTAVLLQHDVLVRFDAATGALTTHEDRNNDGILQAGEPTRRTALDPSIRFGSRNVPALRWGGEAIGFEDGTVTFHRNGSASSEGGIYLSSSRQMESGAHPNETVALEVVRSTGAVRCRAYRSSQWAEDCR